MKDKKCGILCGKRFSLGLPFISLNELASIGYEVCYIIARNIQFAERTKKWMKQQ
ncbi:hypothetical protein [Niallia sp. 03133]|uniref:hypothetical protein n=1 Tax=Niallia sp. 03133 TaxID=3458060 RepID=UPI004044A29A